MDDSRRARWRDLLLYMGGALLLALLLFLVITELIERTYARSVEQYARAQAALLASDPALLQAWQSKDEAALAALLARSATAAGGRVTALRPDGTVVADSEASAADLADIGRASEVQQALRQGAGRAVRPAGPDDEQTLFLAAPVLDDGAAIGILRSAIPFSTVYGPVRTLEGQIGALLLVAALGAMGLLLVQRSRRTAQARRLSDLVERALKQEFDGHVLDPGPGELGWLTLATNSLVDKYRKASKRRAREKDRLNTILTHMGSGALILNEFGRVRLINPAAAQMLHTKPEAALRQSFVQVVWDHRLAEVWQRCRASGQEESESIELGGDRFIRITVTPFLGGNASGYLVILNDLSTVRRLEKVRRDFISNVSHELRTPLASLAALVDTLRDGALDDPPAAQRFLDRMEVEVDKMTQMVQELLELSRVESGQLPLRFSAVTVQSLVQPVVERLSTQAERAGVMLTSEAPDDLPRVLADSERMQQVLINLLHNAIKFTPAGGSVAVSAALDDARPGFLTVCVSDTGVGIPAEDQPRIFERFYKTDRSRSGGGTGLGLAIVKHTVQAHGGVVWVQSREGQGSRFYFTIPLETHPAAALPAGAADAVPETPAASLVNPALTGQ